MEALVKLPKTKKDLRIKHFEALSDPLIELENPTLSDMCYFLAKFSNVDIETIKAFTVERVQDMFIHVLGIFEGFKPKAMPPKEITLGGKLFELVNPETVATSWHIDISTKDIKKDAIELASMFYFPKGEVYGALDVNKNFINPIKDRYPYFQQHMELTTFMEANAFFLNYWLKSKRISTVKRNSSQRTQTAISRMIGRQ